jgi:hypothetical protein
MKSNNKINLIIFISFLFFLFSSCNTKDNEIQRKRLLIAPFLKGAKLNYFAWSPTSSSLEADKSRGSFVESVNFDNLSITLNSDSTFIIEKTVAEYRPEFSPNTELISRKGTYSFFEDKLVLNQPIYFPEKAFDGLCFEQYLDTIIYNEQYKCLSMINRSFSSINFQVYLGIEAALNNTSFGYNDKLKYAIDLLNGNKTSDIISITSYEHHFK